MWRLEEGRRGRKGKKRRRRRRKKKRKSAGRLDASEGGEDFCWMLFQLSARSLSLPLSSPQHKHTHTRTHTSPPLAHFCSHVSIQMLCKFPPGLKTLERLRRKSNKGCAAPSSCYHHTRTQKERDVNGRNLAPL